MKSFMTTGIVALLACLGMSVADVQANPKAAPAKSGARSSPPARPATPARTPWAAGNHAKPSQPKPSQPKYSPPVHKPKYTPPAQPKYTPPQRHNPMPASPPRITPPVRISPPVRNNPPIFVSPPVVRSNPPVIVHYPPASSGSTPRSSGTTTRVSGSTGKAEPAKAAPQLPAPLSKLTKNQRDGLKKVQNVLKKNPEKFKETALFLLSPNQQQELIDFLDPNINPGADNLSGVQRGVLEKIANNDLPLTPEEMVIALGVLGQPNVGLNSATADAISQGLIDSLAANLPAPANQPAPPDLGIAIVDLIDRVLQGALAVAPAPVGAPAGGGIIEDAGAYAPAPAPAPLPAPSSGLEPAPEDEEPMLAVRQLRRHLRVKNDTDANLTVYVQYQSVKDEKWSWLPARPGSDEAVVFQIKAGGAVNLDHDGTPIQANRVRIWAVSADGRQIDEHRTNDLWLVDRNSRGERVYVAPIVETFNHTLKFGR